MISKGLSRNQLEGTKKARQNIMSVPSKLNSIDAKKWITLHGPKKVTNAKWAWNREFDHRRGRTTAKAIAEGNRVSFPTVKTSRVPESATYSSNPRQREHQIKQARLHEKAQKRRKELAAAKSTPGYNAATGKFDPSTYQATPSRYGPQTTRPNVPSPPPPPPPLPPASPAPHPPAPKTHKSKKKSKKKEKSISFTRGDALRIAGGTGAAGAVGVGFASYNKRQKRDNLLKKNFGISLYPLAEVVSKAVPKQIVLKPNTNISRSIRFKSKVVKPIVDKPRV